jgi:hypothetical protein
LASPSRVRSCHAESLRQSPSTKACEGRWCRRSSWLSSGQSCVSQPNPTQSRHGDHLEVIAQQPSDAMDKQPAAA